MPEILINVINKIPQLTGDVRQITAGNGDYTVRLVFDDDWADGEKTVLFVRENGFVYPAVKTQNDECAVPEINGVPLREWLYIGVMQGDVRTSRPCGIPVYRSITDMVDDEAVQPDVSLWEDVVRRIDALEKNGGGGSVSDEAIAEAVDRYFEDNPINIPPVGRAVVVLAGTNFDDITVYAVIAPDLESDPVELLTAREADVILVLERENGGIIAPLVLSEFDPEQFTVEAYGNVVTEDGVYNVVAQFGFVGGRAYITVLSAFEGGSGGDVSRAEFDTLAETVDERMIPTYILQDGEKPEDAPEWAVEVIDPHDDAPGGGLTDKEKAEIVQAVIEALPKYSGEVEDV